MTSSLVGGIVLGLCALAIGQGFDYSNGVYEGKIVCYVDNSGGSFSRFGGESQFLPYDLDPTLCTHGIYGFAGISEDFHVFATSTSVDLSPFDESGKFSGYRKFVALKEKSKSFKAILGVGGGNDDRFPERFSRMAAHKESRDTFICWLIEFATKYGFDGINIDWQDPGKHDKENFVTFLREAKSKFDEEGLSLSISASGNVFIAMDGYDLKSIAKHVEFITIRGYDLHDCNDEYTHHHTALGSYPGCKGNDEKLYVEHSMRHFAHNVDPEDTRKIILGIPTYGKTYYLCTEDDGMCAQAGCGYPGPYLERKGTYSYAEICNEQRGDWRQERDENQVSPYAIYRTSDHDDSRQWVAFDDDFSIDQKCQVARDYMLGGAAVWSVDLDDFKAVCGNGEFYITNLIRKHCSYWPDPDPITPPITTTTTQGPTLPDPVTPTKPDPAPEPGDGILVCYVDNSGGSFSRYNTESKFLPGDLDPTLCTHGIYGFAGISADFHVFATLENVDLPKWEGGKLNGYGQFVALKRKSGTFTPILGVGGGYDPTFPERFSAMASTKKSRDTFICCLIKYVQKYGFDGVNIDWQDPEEKDKENFVTFLREARAQFDEAGLSLSISASGNVFVAMDGYDLNKIAKHVDFITIRGYDLHDCNDEYTHHHTALGSYPGCKGNDEKLYVEHSMRHFAHNVDPEDTKKIILGIPTYGKTYYLCDDSEGTGMCATAGCGYPGPYLEKEGTYSYAEICNQELGDWRKERDGGQVSPYGVYRASDRKDAYQWVAYDDEYSISEKCITARGYGLGGAAVWSVDLDDFTAACGHGKFYVTNLIRKYCTDNGTTPTPPSPTPTTTTTSMTVTTTTPVPGPYDGIMVCYIDHFAADREGDAKFYPDNLDPNLCDYGIYGFAGIKQVGYRQFEIFSDMKEVDLNGRRQYDGYRKFVKLQELNPHFVPLLGIGGFNGQYALAYSDMAQDSESREYFIDNVLSFVKTYGFAGVNIDWYDPDECDKKHLTALVQEMKKAFDKCGLIVSIAASARTDVLDRGYDLTAISVEVEFISLRAYNFHNCSEETTHHHTAYGRFANSSGADILLNAVDASYYAVTKVDESRKLVLGIPAFGRTYKLCTDNTGIYAEGLCSGCVGPYTKTEGLLSYYEICETYYNDEENWNAVVDVGMVSPYATYRCPSLVDKERLQWVSYDNPNSIEKKCELIKQLEFGGAMLWSVDQDDFLGDESKWCRSEEFALLKLIREKCFPDISTPTPTPTTTTTEYPPPPDGLMVCYIDHFAADRDGEGTFYPDNLDPTLCEYGIYGFAGIRETRKDVFEPFSDKEETDLDGRKQYDGYRKFVKLQEIYPYFKPILGIGGYYNRYQYADAYSRMAENAGRRATFISNVIKFVKTYGFVGVNIDWYDPGDCDKHHLTFLVQEMKSAFVGLGLTLSITVSAERSVMEGGYDLTAISNEVEFISLRAYNFHNCSEEFVHHHAPFGRYSKSRPEDVLLNAADATSYAISEVVDPIKLVLGIPAFGRSYKLCTDNTDIYAEGLCSECVGPYTNTEGLMSYYEICEARNYNGDNWVVKNDTGMVSPYATFWCPSLSDRERKQWVSYDNANSIEAKCDMVKKFSMAGVMVYSVDQDDFSGDSSKWCKNDETFSLLRLIREKCLY